MTSRRPRLERSEHRPAFPVHPLFFSTIRKYKSCVMTYQELNFDDFTVVVADFLPIVGSMFIKDSSLLFSCLREP
ncbi:hypothetical protein OUZ56_015945 [Daphnia magna]|uniref:Uncharacterized protein n=1 Tax=Daphnia magna TaxID=35525 RepID=A0ABR0AP77_9CRUS|nr:hypothetical protein OUZ56_015945 [Daphnia magna]